VELRSLDAIHLATAQLLGKEFGRVVTYDERMAEAARVLGMRVAEVPTTWRDRTAGQSRFQLWQWLPRYLRWYWQGIAGRLGANKYD